MRFYFLDAWFVEIRSYKKRETWIVKYKWCQKWRIAYLQFFSTMILNKLLKKLLIKHLLRRILINYLNVPNRAPYKMHIIVLLEWEKFLQNKKIVRFIMGIYLERMGGGEWVWKLRNYKKWNSFSLISEFRI